MALELLIAVPTTSRFRFDSSLLATLAKQIWPEADHVMASGQTADIIDRYVYLPTGDLRRCELAVHRTGDGIGITAPTETVAADAISWICAVSRPPADDEVVLVNWVPELVPLSAGVNSADLLRLLAR
jgi:hypothetical protein